MHKSFITGIAAFSLVVVAFMPAGADPGGLPVTPGAVAEPVESPLAPAALVSVVPGAGTPELPPEMVRVEKEAREGGGIQSAMRAHLDHVAAANRGDATYDPDVRISGHSASTWEDAASLADAEETSLAQALTDVVGGGAGVTMQDILEEHQNGLVIWGQHAGTGNAWVLWTGQLPSNAAMTLAQLAVERTEVYSVPYTLTDALDASAHAQALAQSAFPDALIATEIDFLDSRLRVTIGAEPEATPTLPRQVDGFPVVASFDNSLRMDLATGGRGGAQLTKCTSSFTLRSTTGTYAVGTAGHCADTSATTYQNLPPDGPGAVTLYGPTSYYHSGYDLGRWQIGPLVPLQTFYYDWGKKRYVDDVAYVGVNIPVWFFDRTSQTRHSERTESVWQTCGGRVGLIYNDKHLGSEGDSGGPMYSGDFAMGVYHGSSCHGKDVFTHATLYATISPYAIWER